MDKTTYVEIALGVMFLGCTFIAWDYFMFKLSERANPPGSPMTKEEWMLSFDTDEERRRYRFRKKNYRAVMAIGCEGEVSWFWAWGWLDW